MASTKHPSDAFDYVKRMIKSMPFEQVATPAVNRLSYYLWTYAPWRWTLASTPTFTLTAATQDYTISYPSDWLYAVRATVTDGLNAERNLKIFPSLETAVGFVGQPNWIAFPGAAGGSGTVRISPKPTTVSGTQTVIGLYKKQMTAFTNQTIYTGTMPFDDQWFWVFEEGLLWQGYLFADDRRAGDANIDPSSGKLQFSGQRATFEAALQIMKEREPLLVVDPFDLEQKDIRK